MATAARSSGLTSASAPPSRPIGVRTALTIPTSGFALAAALASRGSSCAPSSLQEDASTTSVTSLAYTVHVHVLLQVLRKERSEALRGVHHGQVPGVVDDLEPTVRQGSRQLRDHRRRGGEVLAAADNESGWVQFG